MTVYLTSKLARIKLVRKIFCYDGAITRSLLLTILAGTGGLICVGALEFAAAVSRRPFWQLPFITSIALVMGAPQTEPARPRALIVGHLTSAISGYSVIWLFGCSDWAAALGVGLSIFTMLRLKVFHPPAAVDAFLVIKQNLEFEYLFSIVAVGAILLAAFAFLWQPMTGKLIGALFPSAECE